MKCEFLILIQLNDMSVLNLNILIKTNFIVVTLEIFLQVDKELEIP